MRPHPIHAVLIAAGSAAVLALGGCVVYPNDPYYGGYGAYGGGYGYGAPGPAVVAPVAPPAIVAESYGVAPYPGAIWIGGYWGWTGGRHVWSPGRWEAPRAGYRWAPRTWAHGRDGWHQRGGHWERH
jgi:hypothetical protein